ncbi:MAG TPA: hypothetical protein VM580_11785, partial [Labilithrix sp.]|nr:hypothetical protein [Labilithrix sp.]
MSLTELEERVDRLRALYEQYFMGYEKIEPGVQRKDVERRFVALRKLQIRNTALRFRFNVITQKYNTYSTYWTRICRQIEEGTFKRHVARAARRFGAPLESTQDQEISVEVEVEMSDFDEDDVAALLAEAEADAAAAIAAQAQRKDTLAPGIADLMPIERQAHSFRQPTRDTSFAMGGGRETFGTEPPLVDFDDAALLSVDPAARRMARPAALPSGAKPRIVVRRREEPSPRLGHGALQGRPLVASGPDTDLSLSDPGDPPAPASPPPYSRSVGTRQAPADRIPTAAAANPAVAAGAPSAQGPRSPGPPPATDSPAILGRPPPSSVGATAGRIRAPAPSSAGATMGRIRPPPASTGSPA